MVCQQHKPLHRKTIPNEKSSTKDEGCINKEQKSPQLQWKRACNTNRRNLKPASAVLVLFMTKLTAKININCHNPEIYKAAPRETSDNIK